jgi:SH3-like domain-containing protein
MEDSNVNKVRSLYKLNGKGMKMKKGEVMIIIKKKKYEWWNVRKEDGNDGFVNDKYVSEIENKVVKVKVRKNEKINEVKSVKKKRMVKKFVKKRRVRNVKDDGNKVRRK